MDYIFFISLDQTYIWVKILCLIPYVFLFFFTSLYLALPSPWACRSQTFDHLHMFMPFCGGGDMHTSRSVTQLSQSFYFFPLLDVNGLSSLCRAPRALSWTHSQQKGQLQGAFVCNVFKVCPYSELPPTRLLTRLEPVVHPWHGRCAADKGSIVVVDPTQLLSFGISVREKTACTKCLWPWAWLLKVSQGAHFLHHHICVCMCFLFLWSEQARQRMI